ncbi:hypothetical protein ACL02T_04660 [Pseudonocardia sp. RS010]|uniref:hypothetical protein n=1 Tax=Pseudonocardia sp. RS010 TaxID=3385979 RepID=UPI0039A15B0B
MSRTPFVPGPRRPALSPELADAATTSTHPAEVAVTLESVGINDRVARERFAARDVFALAGYAGVAAAGRPRTEPEADPPPAAGVAHGPGASRWFHVRGLLYAVPALVALSLLPAGDHVESGLLIGGLALSWALGYGVTYVAWSYLGALDVPAAHRSLRRAIAAGTAAATVVAVVAVFGSLVWTMTMQVTLGTVALLVGQTVYLLSAATLLMTGSEARLLVALTPAGIGALINAVDGEIAAPLAGPSEPGRGWELGWLAATVLLALVFAVQATRRAAPPRQPLPRTTYLDAVLQVAYGLMVAVLVLYPALFELTVRNYDSLPLSVTLAALPLVLGMGVAETLLRDHRAAAARLLAGSRTTAEFAGRMRRAMLRAHLQFTAALALITVALGGLGAALFDLEDIRYVVLGVDYLILGTAVFSGMVLNLLGRLETVLKTAGGAVAALLVFQVVADHRVDDLTAILWQGAVSTVLLVLHAFLVRRHAGTPVHHR